MASVPYHHKNFDFFFDKLIIKVYSIRQRNLMFSSASSSSNSMIHITDFSYMIIDVNSNDSLNVLLGRMQRCVDELSVEAVVVQPNSYGTLPDCIKQYIRQYSVDNLLEQVPEDKRSTYVVSDEELGDYMSTMIIINCPQSHGCFMDLNTVVSYITNTIFYTFDGLSFANTTEGNVVIANVYRP